MGLFIASIAAVISYNDGLFVARLAGNHDNQAYLYPFLADGLIVVCLLALTEAARAQVPRSRWAQGGIVLGIVLTLAMNVDAGLAHSLLDAVLDGMVPVVFFIAVEVVLWHVRHGRPQSDRGGGSPHAAPVSGTVPPSPFEAAKARMRQADAFGFKYSNEQASGDWKLSRAQVTKARQQITEEEGGGSHGRQRQRERREADRQGPRRQAGQDPRPRQQPEEQVAVSSPAGPAPVPAGVNGHKVADG